MEEQEAEKPFDIVSIVMLLMITGFAGIFNAASDLAAAVPVIGQVTFISDRVINLATWALVQFWFFIKLGFFGGPGLVTAAGGLLETIGVPESLLITTAVAMFMANHRKLAAVAEVATVTVATGGVGAAAGAGEISAAAAGGAEVVATGAEATSAGVKTAATGAEAVAETAGVGAEIAGAVETEMPVTEIAEVPAAEVSPRVQEAAAREETAPEAAPKPDVQKGALGEEPTPLEELLEQSFQELPAEQEKEEENEEVENEEEPEENKGAAEML